MELFYKYHSYTHFRILDINFLIIENYIKNNKYSYIEKTINDSTNIIKNRKLYMINKNIIDNENYLLLYDLINLGKIYISLNQVSKSIDLVDFLTIEENKIEYLLSICEYSEDCNNLDYISLFLKDIIKKVDEIKVYDKRKFSFQVRIASLMSKIDQSEAIKIINSLEIELMSNNKLFFFSEDTNYIYLKNFIYLFINLGQINEAVNFIQTLYKNNYTGYNYLLTLIFKKCIEEEKYVEAFSVMKYFTYRENKNEAYLFKEIINFNKNIFLKYIKSYFSNSIDDKDYKIILLYYNYNEWINKKYKYINLNQEDEHFNATFKIIKL